MKRAGRDARPALEAASGAVSPAVARVLLAAVIVLWGSNWAVMKAGLRDIPPFTFVAARFMLGALCMLGLLAAIGRLRLPSRADLPIVVSVGLLQMSVFNMLVMLALQHVPAGRSAILAYTTPLWVVPGAVLVLGERLTRGRLAGLALGIGGVAVLFNPLGFDWGDRSVVLGNGLLLFAAILWATQIVHVRAHTWRSSPLELAPWQLLLAGAVALPVAIVAEGGRGIHGGPQLAEVLLYNGPVATAFCFWAAITIARALPAMTSSLGLLGVPVAGVVASALALGERLDPADVAGLVLIVAGLAAVSLSDRSEGAGAPGLVPPGSAMPDAEG